MKADGSEEEPITSDPGQDATPTGRRSRLRSTTESEEL
jgi:hypothetical protein